MRHAYLASEVVQFGRGAVGHFAVVGDAARDCLDQPAGGWQAQADLGQVGGGRCVFIEESVQVAHGHQRGLDVKHFLGIEHPPVCRQVYLLANVMRRADG